MQKFRPKLVVNLKNCVVLDCAGNDGADEGERRLTDSWDVAGDGDIRLTDPSDQPPRKRTSGARSTKQNRQGRADIERS